MTELLLNHIIVKIAINFSLINNFFDFVYKIYTNCKPVGIRGCKRVFWATHNGWVLGRLIGYLLIMAWVGFWKISMKSIHYDYCYQYHFSFLLSVGKGESQFLKDYQLLCILLYAFTIFSSNKQSVLRNQVHPKDHFGSKSHM